MCNFPPEAPLILDGHTVVSHGPSSTLTGLTRVWEEKVRRLAYSLEKPQQFNACKRPLSRHAPIKPATIYTDVIIQTGQGVELGL